MIYYDNETKQPINKCNICKYRYACNEQDEWICKNKAYNRFGLDLIKLKLYDWKEIK